MVQVFVRRSSAEVLQDLFARLRQLQCWEMLPAPPQAGRLHQEEPAATQLPVPGAGPRVLVFGPGTVQRAVADAVPEEPAQT